MPGYMVLRPTYSSMDFRPILRASLTNLRMLPFSGLLNWHGLMWRSLVRNVLLGPVEFRTISYRTAEYPYTVSILGFVRFGRINRSSDSLGSNSDASGIPGCFRMS
ncbi:MAG: hypothetical protein CM1200mP27_01350 [Chloroflexota bacterium]|nr:MAG: hypothetical protein CM1200mP27_01350 [Chloroflexota bacterium]